MNIRADIKYLLFENNVTMTQLAEEMTKQTGKLYTMHTISQKLIRNNLKAGEYKLIAQILGYEVKLIKKYPSKIKPKNKE